MNSPSRLGPGPRVRPVRGAEGVRRRHAPSAEREMQAAESSAGGSDGALGGPPDPEGHAEGRGARPRAGATRADADATRTGRRPRPRLRCRLSHEARGTMRPPKFGADRCRRWAWPTTYFLSSGTVTADWERPHIKQGEQGARRSARRTVPGRPSDHRRDRRRRRRRGPGRPGPMADTRPARRRGAAGSASHWDSGQLAAGQAGPGRARRCCRAWSGEHGPPQSGLAGVPQPASSTAGAPAPPGRGRIRGSAEMSPGLLPRSLAHGGARAVAPRWHRRRRPAGGRRPGRDGAQDRHENSPRSPHDQACPASRRRRLPRASHARGAAASSESQYAVRHRDEDHDDHHRRRPTTTR